MAPHMENMKTGTAQYGARYIPSVSSTDSHGSIMRGLLISESSFKHTLLELLHYLNRLQRATGFKVISFAFRRFVHHKLFFFGHH